MELQALLPATALLLLSGRANNSQINSNTYCLLVLMMQTCCIACWRIAVCLGAGGGAPWRLWDNGGHHGWPVHVFA